MTVVATDRGTVPLSGTAIITILIDDINDSRPEFLNPIQTVSVLESAEPGTVIANVTAIDLDLNPKLEYHIISIVAKDDTDRLVPDQEDAFAVNINTGTRMALALLTWTQNPSSLPPPPSLSLSFLLCSCLFLHPSSFPCSSTASPPPASAIRLLDKLLSPFRLLHPTALQKCPSPHIRAGIWYYRGSVFVIQMENNNCTYFLNKEIWPNTFDWCI